MVLDVLINKSVPFVFFSHLDPISFVIDRDYKEVVGNADEFRDAVEQSNIDYDALGSNSNSYAFTFVESISGVKPSYPQTRTPFGVVGYKIKLDVNVSYSPAPIVAGGAFTVGDIFQ